MAPFFSLLSGGASGGFGFGKFIQEFATSQTFNRTGSTQSFNAPGNTKWIRVRAWGGGGGYGAEGQGTRSNRRSNGGQGGRIDAYLDLGDTGRTAQVYVGSLGSSVGN